MKTALNLKAVVKRNNLVLSSTIEITDEGLGYYPADTNTTRPLVGWTWEHIASLMKNAARTGCDMPIEPYQIPACAVSSIQPYDGSIRDKTVTKEEYESVGKNGITAEKAVQSLLCAEGNQSKALRYWDMCLGPVDNRWRKYCNYHGISKKELLKQCRRGKLLQ